MMLLLFKVTEVGNCVFLSGNSTDFTVFCDQQPEVTTLINTIRYNYQC